MEENIPKIKVSARDQWRPPMDQQLKMLIKEKNKKARICSEMKARGNKFEQVKSRAEYNKVRNKVRLHTRKKRKQFETEIANKQRKTLKLSGAISNQRSKVPEVWEISMKIPQILNPCY